MNKTELIKHIAEHAELNQKQAAAAWEAVEAAIYNTLSKGEKVELKGFGTFSLKERAERTGRNPKTGEIITIPAQNVPHFKASKSMKENIREIQAFWEG